MIKQLKPAVALLAGLLFFAGCGRTATDAEENSDEIIEPNLLYGIPADNYRLEQQIIDRGETYQYVASPRHSFRSLYKYPVANIVRIDNTVRNTIVLRTIGGCLR